jgi:hypothetical protein
MFCDDVESILKAVGQGQETGPLVVVFVHGWKHDALPTDSYVRSFHAFLEELVKSQAMHRDAWRRRVIGVYVGWPANPASKSRFLQNLTFWKIRDRADLVARTGEVSKLLNHLHAAVPKTHGLLVIMGHSFGARLVYESVQQTMASNVVQEGQATPGEACRGNKVCHQVHGFGDLVVLLNPAFEAVQYTTFYQFSGGIWAAAPPVGSGTYSNVEGWPNVQPPLMLTIGAENDEATSKGWKVANAGASPVLSTTLTNYRPYLTHELRCENPPSAPAGSQGVQGRFTRVAGVLDRTRPFGPIDCVTLTPVGALSNSPFIVARADRQIIDGHNGIWTPLLRRFLVEYLEQIHEAKRIKGWM